MVEFFRVLYKDQEVINYEKTEVIFRNFSLFETKIYLKIEDPLDKAGAYNLGGLGSLLYTKIEGCFYNVLGLPVPKLENMLNSIDMSLLDFIKP